MKLSSITAKLFDKFARTIVWILLTLTFVVQYFNPHVTIEIQHYHDKIRDGIIRDLTLEGGNFCNRNLIHGISNKFKNRALNYVAEKIFTYSYTLNATERRPIDYVKKCILSTNQKFFCPYKIPFIEKEINEKWWYSKENFTLQYYFPELTIFHHGLRDADSKIKDYIREKYFIDAGAFIGDSATYIARYTNKQVYSYELSAKNYKDLLNYSKINKMDHKIVAFNYGVGAKHDSYFIHDSRSGITSPKKRDSGTKVEIVTIDEEVAKHNIEVGFIKADVEGFGLQAALGAAKTIQKQRPVLAFQMYHNMEEFFGIPEFVMTFPNYIYYFNVGAFNIDALGEFGIFAFPAEVLYPPQTQEQWHEIKSYVPPAYSYS
ncbi:methyltransferase, FkbM family protein [Trichomonas vaginalis G3]|uniref:Methyltransferase, FkbM family protein n=1 Tax=Trichomonas vaginalis (strain ATCC PRA-98 / G3) TaxID=412133 RepID=A2F1K3_TRIV3|nr:methyltransferase, FKBM family protein family [Trichomonas vaginalis G3]EAY01221.1 methyltransferase, FkbM family protein [Trichomonas vaginalis G3]KAI5532499.1 methyltransferase, FKBM family protein family [Trichomonas vaginalis G3]|eukprot:XP_001330137.1 methyltransferase, FkbM family protein [Trichomonas vaginalis G3]